MMHKHIQAKHTKVDGITFDSKAESECYLVLKKYVQGKDIYLETQPKIFNSKISWKVDFALTAITREGKHNLQQIALKTNRQLLKNTLYVEYKGKLDKNFTKKFEYLCHWHTDFTYSVLLLSSYGFGYTTVKKNRMISHPIIALSDFKKLIF